MTLLKLNGVPEVSHGLAGRLYLSKSGWLLLSVPNALVHGLYAALDEPGVEYWLNSDGKLNAHVSVMDDKEVAKIGPDMIDERGRSFRYTIGKLKKVNPGSAEYNAVWYATVHSPDLEALRKSYGLSARPKDNQYDFHVTIARRKTNVLRATAVSKAAQWLRLAARGALSPCGP